MIFKNADTGETTADAMAVAQSLGVSVVMLLRSASPPDDVHSADPLMSEVPTSIAPWAVVDDGAFVLAQEKAAALAAVDLQRWKHSLSFTFGETEGVASDDQAQSRAANTLLLLSQPETAGQTVAWQLTKSLVVQMDREQVRQLGLAMGQHVQACWARAAALAEQVNAASSDAELAQIDSTAGWPA